MKQRNENSINEAQPRLSLLGTIFVIGLVLSALYHLAHTLLVFYQHIGAKINGN